MPIAEILSQGDEVVTGQTVDTNAAWLSEKLVALGFTVARHTAVPDDLGEIVDLVRQSSGRADLVVCTGGLGPTADDLTSEAVAAALHRPLQLHQPAIDWVQRVFQQLGRPMPQVNEKQGLFPQGCLHLPSQAGTAWGFAVQQPRALMVFLPGPPREVKHLWAEQVLPLLGQRFDLVSGRRVTLHCMGIGESTIQQRLQGLELHGITVAYRTMLPINQVKLLPGPQVTDAQLQQAADQASEAIGASVFAVQHLGQPDPSLAGVVGQLLLHQGATLATAESCTGGRVASMCTAVPGSSAWFTEGAVTYSNAAKQRVAGVTEAALVAHGAVSEVVARDLAQGIRRAAGTTWGLATTGIAGPTGGTPDKPVGTVHIAVAGPHSVHHRLLRLRGERERIQTFAAAGVLDLLRRTLLR